jgi:Flp pilus assembly protein TadD
MKKLAYVLYALLIIAAIGLLVYDYLPDRAIASETLTRAGLLIAGLVLSILRLRVRGNRRRTPANKKTAYTNAYPQYIHANVFGDDPKAQKLFFSAVEDYNLDRPTAGVKKLETLLGQCANSADRYAATVFLALCLDDMGAYDQAVRHYRSAISIKPESSLWSNLGLALERLGRLEESENAYLSAIRLDPQNAFPLNNLAQRYIRLGDYQKAREYALQAIAINPKFPQALSALAISSHLLGDQAGFVQYYRQAVANGYDGQKIKNYLKAMNPEF